MRIRKVLSSALFVGVDTHVVVLSELSVVVDTHVSRLNISDEGRLFTSKVYK